MLITLPSSISRNSSQSGRSLSSCSFAKRTKNIGVAETRNLLTFDDHHENADP